MDRYDWADQERLVQLMSSSSSLQHIQSRQIVLYMSPKCMKNR